MKPRLSRFMGQWWCSGGGFVGLGWSPKMAYANWDRICRRGLQ